MAARRILLRRGGEAGSITSMMIVDSSSRLKYLYMGMYPAMSGT